MISEICCLQGNSQIVSQAGKGLEVANDQGPVNQNQEQKITIVVKIRNKASYDRAVQDTYDPKVRDVSEVLQGRGLLKYAPRRATASTNRTPDQLQMKRAAARLTGERSPVY
jgi:hypothetical protein